MRHCAIWSLKWSLALCRCVPELSEPACRYVLYYAAYPVVGIAYRPVDVARTVAAPIVGAGLVWSFSFIPAGVIDHALAGRGVARAQRNLSYFVVLWIGAVAAWLLLIATNLPPLRH